MDYYKKKSLKFSSTNVSRLSRHAETIKARESSRFKRLSMLRDMSENDVEASLESEKLSEEVKKPAMSRLERMQKWRQEKELKRQLDMKNARKPFYVGKGSNQPVVFNKNIQSMQSSFVYRPKVILNASNVAKSLVSKPPIQPTSKVPTISKQLTKGASIQTSRIPCNLKQKSSAPRSAIKVNLPTSKPPSVKNTPTETKRIIPKVSSLKTNQDSSLPKLTFTKLPGRTVQKASVTNIQKTIAPPKPVSKASVTSTQRLAPLKPVSKALTPASSKKPEASKPVKKENQIMKNVTAKTGFCFKKAANDARKKPAEYKNGPDAVKAERKAAENTKSANAESLLGNHPEITFCCDLSIIKPVDSFAPLNFQFQRPTGLLDFNFDDEEDPLEVMKEIKLKYLNRTSTPSKSRKNSQSPNEASILSHDNTTPLTDSANSLRKVSPASGPQTVQEKNFSASETVDTWQITCSTTSVDASVINSETVEIKKPENGAFENVAGHKLLVQHENSSDVLKSCVVSLTCGEGVPNTAVDIKDLSDPSENEVGEGDIVKISKADELANKLPEQTSEKEHSAKCGDISLHTEDSNFNQNQLSKLPKADAVTELINLNGVDDDDQILKCKDESGSELIENLQESEHSEQPGNGLGLLVELDVGAHLTKCGGVMDTDSASRDSRVNDVGRCEEVPKADAQGDIPELDTPPEHLAADWKFSFDTELNDIKNLAEEKLELVDSDEDEFSGKNDFIGDPEFLKFSNISTGVPPRKRVSTLKSVSILNVIAENSEADVSIEEPSKVFSKKNRKSSAEANQKILTPRRSKRLSRHQAEILKDSKINFIEEEDLLPMTPVTPRRSLRLQKAAVVQSVESKEESKISPKSRSKMMPRRSMRLIDLNTPEKDTSKQGDTKTNLTTDFQRMTLDDSENRNPDDNSLFDNSSSEIRAKSSRVSLLYTPNRRKSVRKSIKGDLICFSPSS